MNLICGINPVLEALNAGERHFDRLLVVKGLRNRRISEAINRAGHLGIPLRFEARDTLDRMAGGIPHQGLIAVVSAKPTVTLESLLEEARTPALVVVLDGVEDPRNLGAILRTVEAAGGDGVLLPERHSAGLSETVARASAGALEHVKVASIGNVVQAIETLKSRGIWVIGFDAGGTQRWDAVDYRQPVALVLGGEGRGIRRLVREHCDHLVSIPLFGHVNSLNVSVAAGIALFEAVRQRGAVPSHVRPIPARSAAAAPRIVGPAEEDAESDPGHVARAVYEAEGEDDVDSSRAHPVGLGEEDDRPAWSGPTVLKAVEPRREFGGGRGRQGRGRNRRPGPRSPEQARGEARRPPSGDGPVAPAPGPPGAGGRRRRRRRGPGGPGGGPPGEGRERGPQHEGSRHDRGPHGNQGQTAPPRENGGGDAPPGPAEGRSGPSEGGPGGVSRRRRRRRRRP
jgi:23S rRNA (guanosine2251-2'-O)-methyltransferase